MLILASLLSLVVAQQVKFNYTILDSQIDQVVWCGASVVVTDDDQVQQEENESATHRKIMFVLTAKGMVYRSLDYGMKWLNLTEQVLKEFPVKGFSVNQIHQSPADSKVLYLIGSGGFSVRTYDCGKSLNTFNHSMALFGFKLNKMDPKLLMAFIEKPCPKSDTLCKEKYRKDLYVTKDAGANWNLVMTKVREASWDKLLQYVMVPDSRIIVSHLAENGSSIVSYSDDYFKTSVPIRWFAFSYYQTPVYLFLLVRADSQSEGYDLEIAPSFSDNYRPREIVLPLDDKSSKTPLTYEEYTFTVLDTSDGQVFLSVSHSDNMPKITNIYMSDANGNEFTVSLLGNVRSRDSGNCDFEHIQGIEGVYIANVYDHNEVERYKSRRRGITDEEESKKRNSFDRVEAYKKTLITYDKGGNWHSIRAPKYDAEGQPTNCNGDCALHLKGRTEANSNPIYSSQSSSGIIIGTGNTGLYLSQKSEELRTYLSRDGGHNWFEILKGSHIYEIGDHGGLIVLANDDKPVNTILYTWDEGQTFDKVKFAEKFSLEVDNILTEPSNMEQKFILMGRQDTRNLGLEDPSDFSQSTLRGVVVSFDFTSLHQRVCTGQWAPNTPESDYEYWTPMNFVGDKCLFGKKIKYLRRKRDAKCFNPEEAQRTMSVESCPCTDEDWECDFGFYRKIQGGDCVPMSEGFSSPVETKPPKNCKGTYKKTQGYKKVPGDQCEGGVYLGPVDVPCPGEEPVQEEESPEQDTQAPVTPNRKPKVNPIKTATLDNTPITKSKNTKPKQESQTTPQEAKSILNNPILIVVVVVVIFLLRSQIQELFLKAFSQSKPQQKKNYYPKSEEELAAARKKNPIKGGYENISLFKNDDDDEEAGL